MDKNVKGGAYCIATFEPMKPVLHKNTKNVEIPILLSESVFKDGSACIGVWYGQKIFSVYTTAQSEAIWFAGFVFECAE